MTVPQLLIFNLPALNHWYSKHPGQKGRTSG